MMGPSCREGRGKERKGREERPDPADYCQSRRQTHFDRLYDFLFPRGVGKPDSYALSHL